MSPILQVFSLILIEELQNQTVVVMFQNVNDRCLFLRAFKFISRFLIKFPTQYDARNLIVNSVYFAGVSALFYCSWIYKELIVKIKLFILNILNLFYTYKTVLHWISSSINFHRHSSSKSILIKVGNLRIYINFGETKEPTQLFT